MMISSRSGKRGIRLCALLCVLVMLLSASAAQPLRKTGAPFAGSSLPRSHYHLYDFSHWVDMDTFIAEWMLWSRFGKSQWFIFACTKQPDYPWLYDPYTDFYTYTFEENSEDGAKRLLFSVEKLSPDGEEKPGFSHFESFEETLPVISQNDLRTIEGEGVYCVGDIHYRYKQNVLTSIHWTTERYAYCLDVNGYNIAEHDLDSGTFVAQLLQKSTAEKAVAKFNTHISLCLAMRKFCVYWLPWILGAAAIGRVVWFVYYRKKTGKERERMTG